MITILESYQRVKVLVFFKKNYSGHEWAKPKVKAHYNSV